MKNVIVGAIASIIAWALVAFNFVGMAIIVVIATLSAIIVGNIASVVTRQKLAKRHEKALSDAHQKELLLKIKVAFWATFIGISAIALYDLFTGGIGTMLLGLAVMAGIVGAWVFLSKKITGKNNKIIDVEVV